MNKVLIQSRFSKNLASYNDNAKIQKRMAERLLTFVEKNEYNSILEIGCGTGFLTKFLCEKVKFKTLEAIDIVEDCKDYILQINPNIEFINADIEEYLKLEDYDRLDEKNKLVESLALSLSENEIYQTAKYLEAYTAVKKASYPKAMVLIDEMLQVNLSKELRSKLLALKLQVLVELNEYRRASIFEAEDEQEVFEGALEAKIDFSKQCIILRNNFR